MGGLPDPAGVGSVASPLWLARAWIRSARAACCEAWLESGPGRGRGRRGDFISIEMLTGQEMLLQLASSQERNVCAEGVLAISTLYFDKPKPISDQEQTFEQVQYLISTTS